MQRRLGIIIAPSLDDMEAALQPSEPPLIEIQFEAIPRISSTEIEVTKDHPSKMGEVSDAALAGG